MTTRNSFRCPSRRHRRTRCPDAVEWRTGNAVRTRSPARLAQLPLRIRLPFALLLVLAAGAPAHAARLKVVIEREGMDVTIAADTWISADAPTAWRVLTDYERYVEFVPGIRESRVLDRRDGHVTVAQSGDVSWL